MGSIPGPGTKIPHAAWHRQKNKINKIKLLPKFKKKTKRLRKRNPNTTLKLVIKSQKKKRGRKKTYKNKSKTMNKMAIRIYVSIINENVNGLNAPTKRHRVAE